MLTNSGKRPFNSSVLDIPAVCACSLKTCNSCAIVLFDKNAHFKVAFFSPPTTPKHTCALIMLFNQPLDVPHLSGGWIILAEEKSTLTQILTNVSSKTERYDIFLQWN